MPKKQIELLTVHQIIEINKQVVSLQKQEHVCLNKAKVESAVSAAFYPGDYPFQYGGIAKVAGALYYFITKAHAFLDGNKRTAGIAATVLMAINGYHLIYPLDERKGINQFADVLDHVAANKMSKDQLISWFDRHKKIIK